MRTMPHRTVLLLMALLLLAPGLRAQESEEAVERLVRAAQAKFEEAKRAAPAGNAALTKSLADESYALLVEADIAAGDSEPMRERFAKLYDIYFAAISELDPVVARRGHEATSQATRTFDEPAEKVDWAPHVEEALRFMLTNKGRRSFMQNSLNRSLRYIPMITQVFREEGIPEELAYMALIESGFRTDPQSHAGALGMWQFMPATALRFNLRIGEIDDRLDPDKSTRAAAQYLKFLYKKFNDWPLAVAAYNCGEGCIDRRRKPKDLTYWQMIEQGKLPSETAKYVPGIVAATLIARDPAAHGLKPPG